MSQVICGVTAMMKKILAIGGLCSSLLLSIGYHPSGLQAQKRAARQPSSHREKVDRAWHQAVYRGLIIGKSRRAEMLHVLGKPKRFGPPEDQVRNDPRPE